MTAAVQTRARVRCPSCGAAIALAAGDRRLSCPGCGLDAAVSQVGTAPGAALVALEPDLTGRALGDYALVEKIGAGGMGTVYRARGPAGDVAVKVIRPGLGVDRAAVRQRFARESAALRRLDHPRVVRLLDHGESEGDDGTSFLVTELVTGEDLAARLARARLSFAETIAIFGEVCDGVAAAHAAGVVHRDLKPANILLGDGGAKVADFGLALLGESAAVTTLTRTGVAMGTFHYLSPEQRKDAGAVDQRTDVWALGVILYEMLTGELPVGSFAPASTLGPPGCDRRVDAIIRRALAPSRADRYATVAELGAAVRALAPRPRKRRVAALAAAALLLSGGAGIAAVAMTGSDPPRPTRSTLDEKGEQKEPRPAPVTRPGTGTGSGSLTGTGTGSVTGTATGTGTGSVTGSGSGSGSDSDSVTGSGSGSDSVTATEPDPPAKPPGKSAIPAKTGGLKVRPTSTRKPTKRTTKPTSDPKSKLLEGK